MVKITAFGDDAIKSLQLETFRGFTKTIGVENNETTGEIFDFAGGCFYGVFGVIRNQ